MLSRVTEGKPFVQEGPRWGRVFWFDVRLQGSCCCPSRLQRVSPTQTLCGFHLTSCVSRTSWSLIGWEEGGMERGWKPRGSWE